MTSSEQIFIDRYRAGQNQVVHEWIVCDCDTPVSAYLKLAKDDPYAFLLESVEGGEKLARYTIIGYDPDLIWTCPDYRDASGNPLDELRAILAKSRIEDPAPDLPPMAVSGLFGYMGYDMARIAEALPDKNPDPLDLPDAVFTRPQVLVIFDNVKHKICVAVSCFTHAKNSDKSPEQALALVREKLEHAIGSLRGALYDSSTRSGFEALPSPRPDMTPEQFHEIVLRGKEYIKAGDIFQFVPSQRWSVPFDLPPFDLYRSLRRLNPSPFLFFMNFGGFSLVGSSPEILVRVRNGDVDIRPIAGTRPRGETEVQDQAFAQDLLSDPKECAEHLMLVDLGRNDVGKVAEIGSVRVTEQFVIEYYSHVMHIVSHVTGKLKKGLDVFDALMSGFPAGTVSGAPKIRAMEIIDELEPVKRKFYGGCVGYLAANGSIDTCIALRTGLVKDGTLYVQAGAGVVYDSVPESEHQECVNKAKAILRAADDAIIKSRKNA